MSGIETSVPTLAAGSRAAQREFNGAAVRALIASIVGLGLGPSGLMVATFTLFIAPMSAEFGWSRADASLPITVLALALALASPLKGWLVDRYGVRAVALPLTAALGLSTAALALVPHGDWRLLAVFGLIGLSAPGNVPYGRLVAAWFERRRGIAYGLLGFGFALVGPIALQATRPMVDGWGWRLTFVVYGALQLVLALPLMWAWFRDPERAHATDPTPPPAQEGHTLGQAWASASFWLVVGNLVLGALVLMGLATHAVPLLSERGLSRAAATDVVSVLWIGAVLSQPLLGWLMDRVPGPRVALPFAAAAAVGLALLPLVQSPLWLSLAMLLVGLGCGGETGTTQYFVARYFGLRHFSAIYGSLQPFTIIVAALGGSWLLGWVHDRTGDYVLVLNLLLGAAVAAALLLLPLPAYRYGRRRSPEAQPTDEVAR